MREINKRMRKGASRWRLTGITTLALALVVFVLMDGLLYFRYHTPIDDVSMAKLDEIKEEECFTIHNPVVYGQYAVNEIGNYYVISIADGTYMGVFMRGEPNETDVWNSEEWNPNVTGRGFVFNMEAVEQQLFWEWFQEVGADSSVMNQLCYKTLVLVPESEIEDDYKGLLFICKLLGAVGCSMLIIYLLGLYRCFFMYSMKKLNITKKDLLHDMENAKHRKEFSVGNRYMIVYNMFPRVVFGENLMWMYIAAEETMNYRARVLLNDGKFYTLHLIDWNKRDIKIPVMTTLEGNHIMDMIVKIAPQVLRGTSPEWRKLYETDFEGLKRLVKERRYEYEYVTHDVTRQDKINRVLAALDQNENQEET